VYIVAHDMLVRDSYTSYRDSNTMQLMIYEFMTRVHCMRSRFVCIVAL